VCWIYAQPVIAVRGCGFVEAPDSDSGPGLTARAAAAEGERALQLLLQFGKGGRYLVCNSARAESLSDGFDDELVKANAVSCSKPRSAQVETSRQP
jgi:hypothetical protein